MTAEDQYADGRLSGIVEAGDQFEDRALSGGYGYDYEDADTEQI